MPTLADQLRERMANNPAPPVIHDPDEDCPECGSSESEDLGTDPLVWRCSQCGHEWTEEETDDPPYEGEGDDEIEGWEP